MKNEFTEFHESSDFFDFKDGVLEEDCDLEEDDPSGVPLCGADCEDQELPFVPEWMYLNNKTYVARS